MKNLKYVFNKSVDKNAIRIIKECISQHALFNWGGSYGRNGLFWDLEIKRKTKVGTVTWFDHDTDDDCVLNIYIEPTAGASFYGLDHSRYTIILE